MNKDMEYKKERDIIILFRGKHKSFRFVVVSYGTHPCCYVEIPKGHKYYKKDYDKINIDCHGGLTYSDETLPFDGFPQKDVWIIGWDYAHYGDYMGYYEDIKERKWTTDELIKECKEVIKQLEEKE